MQAQVRQRSRFCTAVTAAKPINLSIILPTAGQLRIWPLGYESIIEFTDMLMLFSKFSDHSKDTLSHTEITFQMQR